MTVTRKAPKAHAEKKAEVIEDAVVIEDEEEKVADPFGDENESPEDDSDELDEDDLEDDDYSEESDEDEDLTDEEKANRKAEMKEARKQAAFAKLRELNQAKKAVRKNELEERTTKVQGALKQGDIKYSTRASYYGVRCRVEKVEEVRGRVLVTVTCMTTKGGSDLPEERYYIRRFSPEFLQDDKPTEAYVPRRGGAVKVKKVSKAEQKRRAKQAKEAAHTGDDGEAAVVTGESEEDEVDTSEELDDDDEYEEDEEEDDKQADEDSWA